MMPIYIRYLSREIYASVALVLVAFLGLFAFFDLVNELDDIGKSGYQLYQAAMENTWRHRPSAPPSNGAWRLRVRWFPRSCAPACG